MLIMKRKYYALLLKIKGRLYKIPKKTRFIQSRLIISNRFISNRLLDCKYNYFIHDETKACKSNYHIEKIIANSLIL